MRTATMLSLVLVAGPGAVLAVAGPLDFTDVTRPRVVRTVPEADGPHMKGVAIGDFDLDGDADVAVAAAAGEYGCRQNVLYRNDGGTLVEISGAPIIAEFSDCNISRVPAFRDFDGDGWLDLLIVNDSAEQGERSQLFINRHPGGAFSGFLEEGEIRNLGFDFSCGAVAEDVDGDGDADIFINNYSYGSPPGQSTLYLNDGAGVFTEVTATHVPPETDFGVNAAAADLNGDGRLDLLLGNKTAPFWAYYNDLLGQAEDGPGDFRYGADGGAGKQDLGTNINGGALEPADFNGDARPDIYWTNGPGGNGDVILMNTGIGPDGKAIFETVLAPPYPRSVASTRSVAGDLDGDGRIDIVVMTMHRPAILRNTSVGGAISFVDWTPAPSFPSGIAHRGFHAALLDAGGDGDLDLFIGGDTGDHLFENAPGPTFDEASLGGVLPPLLDQAPIAVNGSAAPGRPDVYAAPDLDDGGFVSIVLGGAADLRLRVRRDGVVVAESDRGGAGVEEALQVELAPGAWTIEVAVQSGPGGPYVLEALARDDTDGLPNDDCTDAEPIAAGNTVFTTITATTDGPAHAACDDFGDDQVPADVWFVHEAACTGLLTVSTCGTADYDTKLAVYDGTTCPVTDAMLLGCNEDTDGCAGFTSEVSVPVTCGGTYMIRLGGYLGATGNGVVSIDCAGACPCATDANGDLQTDIDDLVIVVLAFGTSDPDADVNADGLVNVDDIVEVILNWGPCSP